MRSPSCIAVVPIYKPVLSNYEIFNLEHSLRNLNNKDITLIAPQGLNLSFYSNRFHLERVEWFNQEFFQSVSSYSKLLLSDKFYERFQKYDFTLVLQTDAIILKDALDAWTSLEYDYIGAPWPNGWQMRVRIPELDRNSDFVARSFVGNGGLSLRKNNAILDLLDRFCISRSIWVENKWPEDLFFSMIGEYSQDFRTPNLSTAAAFSIEQEPLLMMKANGNRLPFGLHAWKLHGADYWLKNGHLMPPSSVAAVYDLNESTL